MTKKLKRSIPWYEQFDKWNSLACKYMRVYINTIFQNEKYKSEFRSYEDFSSIKVVFESNLIEGAGMTLGNTEKVISQYFPRMPGIFYDFRKEFIKSNVLRKILGINWEEIRLKLKEENKSIKPSYIFSHRSKGAREVLQHYKTIKMALVYAIDYRMKIIRYKATLMLKDPALSEDEKESLKKIVEDKPLEQYPDFLTEDHLKDLHASIAEGLLDKDVGVDPGEYRIDSRHAGYNIIFPAPESITNSMKLYIETSNKLIKNIEATSPENHFNDKDCNVFLTAARISYDFVRIHPFPDFNGRISRIILMMVLHLYGLPFFPTLRGDKQGRNRYLRALKSANNGDLKPYATLIALNVVKSFREIDQNLKIAGLTPLEDIKE